MKHTQKRVEIVQFSLLIVAISLDVCVCVCVTKRHHTNMIDFDST